MCSLSTLYVIRTYNSCTSRPPGPPVEKMFSPRSAVFGSRTWHLKGFAELVGYREANTMRPTDLVAEPHGWRYIMSLRSSISTHGHVLSKRPEPPELAMSLPPASKATFGNTSPGAWAQVVRRSQMRHFMHEMIEAVCRDYCSKKHVNVSILKKTELAPKR